MPDLAGAILPLQSVPDLRDDVLVAQGAQAERMFLLSLDKMNSRRFSFPEQ